MLRILAIGLALLCAAGGAQAQTAPYEFKGVPVGIELEAFRTRPFPEGRPSALVDHGQPIAVGCERENEYGIIECDWRDSFGPVAVRLGSNGRLSRFYSFNFIRDPVDERWRLSRVFIGGRFASATPATLALIELYGEPTSRSREDVVTRDGSAVPQTTLRWENGVSSISIQVPSGDLDSILIIYEDARLGAIARERREQIDRQRNPKPM